MIDIASTVGEGTEITIALPIDVGHLSSDGRDA